MALDEEITEEECTPFQKKVIIEGCKKMLTSICDAYIAKGNKPLIEGAMSMVGYDLKFKEYLLLIKNGYIQEKSKWYWLSYEVSPTQKGLVEFQRYKTNDATSAITQ